jgi:hypothetical protein
MAKKNKHLNRRRRSDRFFMVPKRVFDHEDFILLSARGLKLLVDLLVQYSGYNNGDLCGAMSLMKVRGWNSNDQLHKAKKELIDRKLIVVSRQGGRKKATLYALTWLSIDDCKGKLDIKSTNKPWRDFIFEK